MITGVIMLFGILFASIIIIIIASYNSNKSEFNNNTIINYADNSTHNSNEQTKDEIIKDLLRTIIEESNKK